MKIWSAFNPSIAMGPNGPAILIRSSNYVIDNTTGHLTLTMGYDINTRTWFSELNDDLELVNLRELSMDSGDLLVTRGVEDARLLWRDGGWQFTAVMLEKPHTKYARLCLYDLDPATDTATFITQYEGPDPKRAEKNWMAPSKPSPHFDFVYSQSSVLKDGVLHQLREPTESARGVRGGSSLLLQDDGSYLAVVHRVLVTTKSMYNPRTFGMWTGNIRHYTHMFARYNEYGMLTHLSPEFIFESSGIEYAAGLIEHGNDLIVSWGQNDVSACLSRIDKKLALDMLEPVT